jgi:hypothetical protein
MNMRYITRIHHAHVSTLGDVMFGKGSRRVIRVTASGCRASVRARTPTCPARTDSRAVPPGIFGHPFVATEVCPIPRPFRRASPERGWREGTIAPVLARGCPRSPVLADSSSMALRCHSPQGPNTARRGRPWPNHPRGRQAIGTWKNPVGRIGLREQPQT